MFLNPLHRARLERGITLEEVTSRSCLSPRIVHLLDAGLFDQLPGGLYARSYVRTFAAVVGLKPEIAITELGDRLPADQDPMPILRQNARAAMTPWAQDAANLADRLKAAVAGASSRAMPRLRMPVKDAARPPADDRTLSLIAITVDVSILTAFYASLIRLTAWTAGIGLGEALTLAGIQVAAVCGLIMLPYFLMFRSLGGRALGRVLCAGPPAHPRPQPDGDHLSWESDPDRVRAGC